METTHRVRVRVCFFSHEFIYVRGINFLKYMDIVTVSKPPSKTLIDQAFIKQNATVVICDYRYKSDASTGIQVFHFVDATDAYS